MTDISSSNDAGAVGTESVGNRLRWLPRRRLLFVGLAPVLVSLAPCDAMCGLGLCMKGGSGGKCNDAGGGKPDQPER
mgnify:CR=1 FL=1